MPYPNGTQVNTTMNWQIWDNFVSDDTVMGPLST